MRLIAATMIFAGGLAAQPKTELLWPNGAPGALGSDDKDKPSLTFYPVKGANNNTGTAVVVCPGGGYGALAMDHEGVQIARFLNYHGIGAFVLKYRLGPKYHHPAPLDDVHQAIRMVRTRAEEFGAKPDRIGVWGFSAGGHLASTAATHFEKDTRPDFAILSYPVITFTDEANVHKGSRRNLLGDNPDPKLVEFLSSEKQVTPQTPPTFLFHTNEDTGVPPENSVLFYLALRKAKVPAEMHIFEPGKHGVGLAPSHPVLSQWGPRLIDWFKTRGLMTITP
ncbi:MAG: alpha/beta hydrolase [Bryobacteraceae bacterium]|nr:alpha/beta hydrolase [Bryobacteraceae bacterium]